MTSVTISAAASSSALTTVLNTYATAGTNTYDQMRNCLYLEPFYQAGSLTTSQRSGQLNNCYLALYTNSSQVVFDNLQEYTLNFQQFSSAVAILTEAFKDNLAGKPDPGTDALNIWLQYLYVQISNKVPWEYYVTTVRMITDASISTLLTDLQTQRKSITLAQNATISFLVGIFNAGIKISAVAGEKVESRVESTFTRWGRVKQISGQTDGFSLSFDTV